MILLTVLTSYRTELLWGVAALRVEQVTKNVPLQTHGSLIGFIITLLCRVGQCF